MHTVKPEPPRHLGHERFVAKAAAIANVALVGGAIASAAVLFLSLHRYAQFGQPRASDWRGAVIHYAAPALAAALFLAALRLKPDRRINLALAGLTLAIATYGGELALRLWEPSILRGERPVMTGLRGSPDKERLAARLAKTFGVEIDARDGLEVLEDLRRQGIEAVPSVSAFYRLRHHRGTGATTPPPILALGGISNKVTVLCNEGGQYVSYEADEHGFRNPKALWRSERIDVAAVGDSFTQGYCVPAGRHFVDILREHYPSTLNLGMAGNGPLMMLATLKEYVAPFRPPLVLWCYFEGNDLPELKGERESTVLMRYLDRGFTQQLGRRQDEVDRGLAEFVEMEKATEMALRRGGGKRTALAAELGDFMRLSVVRRRLRLVVAQESDRRQIASELEAEIVLFRQVLAEAKADVESWGGSLYFVYLPGWARYGRFRPRLQLRAGYAQRENVLVVARDLGLPIIDVVTAFDAVPDAMALFPFHAPGHYTEDGHRLLAHVLVKHLPPRIPRRVP